VHVRTHQGRAHRKHAGFLSLLQAGRALAQLLSYSAFYEKAERHGGAASGS
jgi:hypothetical protein